MPDHPRAAALVAIATIVSTVPHVVLSSQYHFPELTHIVARQFAHAAGREDVAIKFPHERATFACLSTGFHVA